MNDHIYWVITDMKGAPLMKTFSTTKGGARDKLDEFYGVSRQQASQAKMKYMKLIPERKLNERPD
jgi:hypothetical protein